MEAVKATARSADASSSTTPASTSSSPVRRASSSSARKEATVDPDSSITVSGINSGRTLHEATAGHTSASASAVVVNVAPSQPGPAKIKLLQRPVKSKQTEQTSHLMDESSTVDRSSSLEPSSSAPRSPADAAHARALGEGQSASNRPTTTPSQATPSQLEAQPLSPSVKTSSGPTSDDGYPDGDGSSDGGPERPRTPSATSSTSELDPSDPAPSLAPPRDLVSRTREPTITAEGPSPSPGEDVPVLDHVLLSALQNPRDRILLLRAEVEMERFVSHPSAIRLPLSPPHFQPNLNSYQRLLIHRLADIFGITREVEAAPQQNWVPPGAPVPGIVVLVKGPATKLPASKLASIVAPPSTASTSSAAPALVHAIVSSNEASTSTTRHSSDSESPARGGSPSSLSSNAPPPPTQPQVFKILPRSVHKSRSTASSPAAGDDESTGRGKARRELTLEEREAAYREARERIFAQQSETKPAGSTSTQPTSIVVDAAPGLTRPSSAGSTYSRGSAAASIAGSRAESTTSSYHSGYHPGPASAASMFYPIPSSSSSSSSLLSRSSWAPSLRPSAPSFDPSLGWIPQGYEHDPYQQPPPQHQHNYYGGPSASAGLAPPNQFHRQTPSHPSSPSTNPYANGAVLPPPPPPLPHPNHAPHPHPTFATAPASEAYGTGPAASAWATPRPSHALPSPSLSTSSGSSYQSMGLNAKVASGGSNQRLGQEGSYLMRFPEGGVVPYHGSSLESGSTNSSQASLHSTSQGSAAPPPSEPTRLSTISRNGERLASPASSLSPNARPLSSVASIESSSSGGGKAKKTLIREGTVKGKGKEHAGEVVDAPSDALSASNLKSLHPSLPIKPEWTSNSNGVHRASPDAPSQSGSTHSAPSAQPPATMRASPSAAYTTAPPQFLQSGYHTQLFRPPSSMAPTHAYAAAPNGYQPLDWYSTYPHASAPSLSADPGYPYYADHGGFAPGAGGSFSVAASPLSPPNEMRRPPPRSTELFDPNKPLNGSSAAGMRPARGRATIRGGGAGGHGVGVRAGPPAGLEHATEGLRL
ncbi:BQ2448_5862 [Microbotryum intermedium]|uniref:BQ2448_5862 protein n=1 Tax=Microbotryum intermedium TaxID=269621 RepID=A0A238F806_9BASI|nr:BQ2448_5862 [Microbotryum intermedium]